MTTIPEHVREPSLTRRLSGHPVGRWMLDLRLPLVLVVIGLVGTHGAGLSQPDALRQPDLLAYLLVTVAALSLALRRWPITMLALVTAASMAWLARGYPFGPILLTLPIALYLAAVVLPLRRAIVAAAVVLVAFVAITVAVHAPTLAQTGDLELSLTSELLWFPLAWLAIVSAAVAIGTAVGSRRSARAELARRAVSEEQLRMARELHDVVGHGLAVISMQAGVALHVLDRQPDKARESLEAIRATSVESLDSLRSELARLRPDTEAPRRPLPDIDDIEVLVDRIRAGGLDVGLLRPPGFAEVPPEVAVAAYRIVQEALTNVLRHAQASRADVRLTVEDGLLVVRVRDDGRGPDPEAAGGGTGIAGMRERATAVGGALRVAPPPDGGFEVTAELPLGRRDLPGATP